MCEAVARGVTPSVGTGGDEGAQYPDGLFHICRLHDGEFPEGSFPRGTGQIPGGAVPLD